MVVEKNLSVAIVDVEKIDDINKVIFKYATYVKEYSAYYYFNLRPMRGKEIKSDITLFQLDGESESELDKKLNDLIEELNQLNTLYAIRDEDTHEMIKEIDHVIAVLIKFDNVKVIKEGTYEKIDDFNHLKTEFGICKSYNPDFRPIENRPIENTTVKPESIYLFSDSAENLSKLREYVCERVREIDSNLKIENMPFMFID